VTEILQAIGKTATLPRKVWLLAMFGGAVSAFLLLDHLVTRLLGVPPLVLQVVSWAGWFVWQGWLFGVHRERYLRETPATAYRRAFYRDILPGATFGISQMIVPATYGLRLPLPLTAEAVSLLAALFYMTLGATLFILGFKTIGFGGAGFLNEFGHRGKEVSDWSIYKYVRHPLFLGGILVSVGSACFFAEPVCLALALANVAILPVYARLEDRRLVGILGESYREYCARVGAFCPRLLARPEPALASLTSAPTSAEVIVVDAEIAA